MSASDDPRLGDLSDAARMLHYALCATTPPGGRFPAGPKSLSDHLQLKEWIEAYFALAELVRAGVVRLHTAIVDGKDRLEGELVVRVGEYGGEA